MRRSIDRILVSHAGNLPRPDDLNHLLATGERARAALNTRLPSAVVEVVERQIACGVDIVNDGEYVKAGSYTGYIHQRLTGIEVRQADPSRAPKHAPRIGSALPILWFTAGPRLAVRICSNVAG